MLRYTGAGQGAAADNIPARDLSENEVEEFGGEKFLLSLHVAGAPLYEKVGSKSKGHAPAVASEAARENEAEKQPGGES